MTPNSHENVNMRLESSTIFSVCNVRYEYEELTVEMNCIILYFCSVD